MTMFPFCVALLLPFSVAAQLKSPDAPVEARVSEIKMDRHPMAPEVLRRSSVLRASLQPSAKSWVVRQAKIEARRPSPDVDALRAAIRLRFVPSLAHSGGSQGGQSASGAQSADIDAMAFLVLMEAAQQSDEDLQAQMNQMSRINQQKHAMRQIIRQIEKENSEISKTSQKNLPCATPFCRSLPSTIAGINAGNAGLVQPINLQPAATITSGQLASVKSQISQSLDSLSELSETQSLRLQMAMDQRSKFIETLSNIEKSISDVDDSILQNMK